MKRVTLILALLAIGVWGSAFAFHSGGVAECGGCHSMHSPDPDGFYLLLGEDQSSVCLNCHSETLVEHHFERFDQVVENYNDNYFRPVKEKLGELYDKGLLSREHMFDEDLEVEYYELWHHEGRRARMGAAMMAPDYTWWHGFYELKKRFTHFMHEAERLIEAGTPAYRHEHYPAGTGDTTVPEAANPR